MSASGVRDAVDPLVEPDSGARHPCPAPTPRTATTRFLVAIVHVYQMTRSGRPTGCRYLPTCSEYAVVAIDRHGPGRGSFLAARRIARCHPWGRHGIDPVPERSTP